MRETGKNPMDVLNGFLEHLAIFYPEMLEDPAVLKWLEKSFELADENGAVLGGGSLGVIL